MAQWWAGSECTVVLEKPEDYDLIGKEHNITIMNHKYDIDWLMAWILAERFQMLGVSNKAILLRETIYKFCQGMSDIFSFVGLLKSRLFHLFFQSFRLLQFWNVIGFAGEGHRRRHGGEFGTWDVGGAMGGMVVVQKGHIGQ